MYISYEAQIILKNKHIENETTLKKLNLGAFWWKK